MGMVVWGVLMVGILSAAYIASRLGEKEQEKGFQDTGMAILEFGRAYPGEAIRQLHATSDGDVVFVRLHDNKAGFMRSLRGHYACHLIEPGSVHVSPLADGRGLNIEFIDVPHHNGAFTFASPQVAAEVSLWLLGNYVAGAARMDTRDIARS
nr:hypothetical protein [uncultured Gellertiella sp.]